MLVTNVIVLKRGLAVNRHLGFIRLAKAVYPRCMIESRLGAEVIRALTANGYLLLCPANELNTLQDVRTLHGISKVDEMLSC